MKSQSSIFWIILALVLGIAFTSANVGIVHSQNGSTALEQAQKSLQAKSNSLPSAKSQTPSIVQEIYGTSMVQGVWFTWVIISSESEVSVNLRYVGDGTTPPVSIVATALAKSVDGRPVTMKGKMALDSGWTSPNTVGY